MTCDFACRLIDGYLDSGLSPADLRQLERHLAACPRCTEELRDRLTFEQRVRQAIVVSVQHLKLGPEASRGILIAVEGIRQRPTRSYPMAQLLPRLAGIAIVALLLVGVFFLLEQMPTPLQMQRTALPAASQPASLPGRGGLIVEPLAIYPGDLFTVTVPLEGHQFGSLQSIPCDLDISGPSGHYHFALMLPVLSPDAAGRQGQRHSLRSGAGSQSGGFVLQVTPDLLLSPSQQQYQMSPAEILRVPGIYRFRVALFGQSAAPAQ